jgi:HK97 family phage portal protein
MNFFSTLAGLFRGKKSMYADINRRGQTVWSVQNDEAYIKEAFEKVVWVYSCITKIASCVSSVPWRLYKENKGAKIKELSSHNLLDMFNGNVNPLYSSADFFEIWATYLAIQGKFFALFDNPVMPTMLTPLYPHRVKIKATKDRFDTENMVEYYEYMNEIKFSPNMLLWSKFFDPLDFYDGLSPIRVGARTIDTENSAIAWNKDSFDNLGMPPGGIHLTNPSPDTIEAVKKRWRTDYAGPKNARMPIIFDAEKMNYINFGLNQIDMDFLNQRKVTRTEICSMFGVPGQVVGDPEGQTYANYAEALKSFWVDTVIRRYLNKIRYELNQSVVKKYDASLYLNYDVSGVEVLQESAGFKYESSRGLFTDNIVTQNEARKLIGFDAVENGDVFNYELTSKIMEGYETEEVVEETEEAVNDKSGVIYP